MFTRAQACKSGLAEIEEPAGGPFGAAAFVRPSVEEAVEKPESSPAELAGPKPVAATPGVFTTSEGGRGVSGPEGFSFAGISLRCPGGQAGPTSVEWMPRPPSEQGTRPLPGLATDNDFYQTASSDSDEAATGLAVSNPPNNDPGGHTVDADRITGSSRTNTKPKPRQPPSRAPTAAATGLTKV